LIKIVDIEVGSESLTELTQCLRDKGRTREKEQKLEKRGADERNDKEQREKHNRQDKKKRNQP
jgi:hypothetical protein